MPVCPNCNEMQPDGAAFCDNCGAALGDIAPAPAAPAYGGGVPAQPVPTAVAMTCHACGAPVATGATACSNCGATLGQPPAAPPPQAAVPAQAQTPPPYGGQVGGTLTCPGCGAQLEPGSVFCDMCGVSLGAAAPVQPPVQATPPVQQQPVAPPVYAGQQPTYPPVQQPIPSPVYPAQPSYPSVAIQGRLIVQGTNATLPFPPGKTEIIVGREDPVSGVFPEVDLTDHGGDEGGVSRRHARIFIQGTQVFIDDMNSTNFTYVNQQKLTPGQPHPLNSGDEVRIGRVKLNYYA